MPEIPPELLAEIAGDIGCCHSECRTGEQLAVAMAARVPGAGGLVFIGLCETHAIELAETKDDPEAAEEFFSNMDLVTMEVTQVDVSTNGGDILH